MRTVEEVKSYLKKKFSGSEYNGMCLFDISIKTESGKDTGSVTFNKLNDAINGCLIKLWNDEEIVDAKVFNELGNTETPNVIFLTNKRRLFISKEKLNVSSGVFFTSTNYYNSLTVMELEYVNLNKCRILEIKNESFFGKPKPSVNGNLILDDKTVFNAVNLAVLDGVFKAIIDNIKTYAEKPAEPKPKESAPSSQSGNVAEIRKMYEDGLITREEMLDLIKSIVSK